MFRQPWRVRLWRWVDRALRKIGLERTSQNMFRTFSYNSDGRIEMTFRNGAIVSGWVFPTPEGPLKNISVAPLSYAQFPEWMR